MIDFDQSLIVCTYSSFSVKIIGIIQQALIQYFGGMLISEGRSSMNYDRIEEPQGKAYEVKLGLDKAE